MASGLKYLQCWIYFGVVFVDGMRKESNGDSCVCSCPVFPTPFIEEAVFSPQYILTSFVIDELII